MHPSKLRGRRRRTFAAPFVLTAALASLACGPQATPAQPGPVTQQPIPDGPAIQVDQNGNPIDGRTVNPPPPGTTPTTEPTPPEPGVTTITNPPAPRTLPDAPTDGKGQLVSKADGTCWYFIKIECVPNATCNPPPPMQVNCKAPAKSE